MSKRHMNRLMLLISLFSISNGISAAHNQIDQSWLKSHVCSMIGSSIMGTSIYKLAEYGFNKFAGKKPHIVAQLPQNIYHKHYMASLAAAGIGTYMCQCYFQPLLHVLTSKRNVSPIFVKKVLDGIEDYLVYLKILRVLECELRAKVEKNLDTSKYHATGVESRLQILDAAFYHLKKNSLIAELEKNGRYSYEYITSYLQKIESKDIMCHYLDRWHLIKDELALLINTEYTYNRNELLESIQLQKQHEIFDLLSAYFIHLDIFSSGFNLGIDVIYEARLVNELAKKIRNAVCKQSANKKHALEQLLRTLNYYSTLESLLASVKALTNKKTV